MSLEHSPAKQRRRISVEHLTAADLKVLTLKEWCKLNTLSFATGKRILASGDRVQLSARRVGIRVIDNRIWQEERLRS